MTPLFPARRSAERFDSLVEGGRRDDVDRTTADLLELVSALRSAPEPQARPEFVADLRERLMVAAEAELTPVPAAARHRDDVARLTIKPVRTRHERRLGIALGAVAIIGATTSMAVASQGALPGDALYPVKRAIENTQAGFAFGDDDKGEAILDNASTRLDEVDKLSQQKDPDAKLVTQTLDTFSSQFTEAGNALLADYESNGNEQSIETLHESAADSVDLLGQLEGSIPPAAHDSLLNAAQTVLGLDQRGPADLSRVRRGDPRRTSPAPGRRRRCPRRRDRRPRGRPAARRRRPLGCVPAPAPERRQGRPKPERHEPARDADRAPDRPHRHHDRPRRSAPDRWHRHDVAETAETAETAARMARAARSTSPRSPTRSPTRSTRS